MTKEQLTEMFLAQEAWDRVEQSNTDMERLADSLAKLSQCVERLNRLLKDELE